MLRRLRTKLSRGHVQIVLDTNVIVSGLLRGNGPSGELLRCWTDGAFTLITSPFQIAELRRVLDYERIRLRVSLEQASALLNNIDAMALIVSDLPVLTESPDPDDNPILATAIVGKADLIVSGDKAHMQYLEQVMNIPIVAPQEALRRIL